MRGWIEAVRTRLASVARSWSGDADWRAWAGRSARAGFWVLRGALGLVLVVYALSLVGPPPVEEAEITYAAPDAVAHDALRNLRAATYRVTLTADRTDDRGETQPIVSEVRAIDNGARLYTVRSRTGDAVGTDSLAPRRTYGTYTTGYRRPAARPGDGGGNESAPASWERGDHYRYHPSRNAFENVEAVNGTRATVVTEGPDRYVLRLEDRDVVAEVVSLPEHPQRPEANWSATLTLSIARDEDRLTRAVYRYRVPETGEEVRATYRFTYGPGVDVDRPLATYPPGGEVLTRLDLGFRAIETLIGGTDR